jgi:hypothetical protein
LNLVEVFEEKKMFRGKGGEIMRVAINRFS